MASNGKWQYRARRWYKKGSKSSIKPVSVTKASMQKPTAYKQQKQIIKNSKAITALRQAYSRNTVYTDYQLASSNALDRNAWVLSNLTAVNFWDPVLRQSLAVRNTKMTTCIKMDLHIRMDMGQFIRASVFWNVFLVRPRAAGAGQIDSFLVLNDDYTEQTGYPGRYIKLNLGKYDIIKEWHTQLLAVAATDFITPLQVGALVGTPKTTFKEFRCVLPMNMVIKSFNDSPWVDKEFIDLPYHDQLSLLIYPQCDAADEQQPRFFFDAHFTCVNHI